MTNWIYVGYTKVLSENRRKIIEQWLWKCPVCGYTIFKPFGDKNKPEINCPKCMDNVIRHITDEIGIAKMYKKDFALVDIDMLSDALILIKEQETVEPKLSMSGLWYECPVCHRRLLKNRDNYCARCGKAVMWE